MSIPLAFHSEKAFVLSMYSKIRCGEKYKASYIKTSEQISQKIQNKNASSSCEILNCFNVLSEVLLQILRLLWILTQTSFICYMQNCHKVPNGSEKLKTKEHLCMIIKYF